MGHAVALLSIELAKPARVIDAEHRLRKAVTLALLQDNPNVDPSLLRYFGFTPDTSITVVVFTDVGPLLPAEQQLIAALEDESARYLMANLPNSEGIAFLVNTSTAEDIAQRVYARVRTRLRRKVNGGIGNATTAASANVSLQQALSAAGVGEVDGHKLVSFSRARHLQLAPEHPVTGRAPGDLCPLAGTDRRARQQVPQRPGEVAWGLPEPQRTLGGGSGRTRRAPAYAAQAHRPSGRVDRQRSRFGTHAVGTVDRAQGKGIAVAGGQAGARSPPSFHRRRVEAAARRYCGGVIDIVIGLATWGAAPPGISTVTSSPSRFAMSKAWPMSLMGPAGTPASERIANHSSEPRAANRLDSSANKVSRFSTRDGLSA